MDEQALTARKYPLKNTDFCYWQHNCYYRQKLGAQKPEISSIRFFGATVLISAINLSI